ncbi:hypothetical protein, partial [Klebsiella aerogenes]|uniref:hypothetical protein n=1 Tax=Klebsiella aerogenes TaxID=548 RepID=UPI001954865B
QLGSSIALAMGSGTFLLTVGLILLLGLPLTMDSFIRGLMGMLVTALYTLVYLSFGLFLSLE